MKRAFPSSVFCLWFCIDQDYVVMDVLLTVCAGFVLSLLAGVGAAHAIVHLGGVLSKPSWNRAVRLANRAA